ncbi:hypothetical protein HID58_047727, partial [Brassica napus]
MRKSGGEKSLWKEGRETRRLGDLAQGCESEDRRSCESDTRESFEGCRSLPELDLNSTRRDGRTANRGDAVAALPLGPDSMEILTSKFSVHNLDTTDLVALSGAHTIGRVQCGVITNRLHNFTGRSLTARVNLDPTSPDSFDNDYFKNLQNNRGVIESDQILFSSKGAPT